MWLFLSLFVPRKITKFPRRWRLVSNCQIDMMSFLAFVFVLQSIRVSIFYGSELVFKVSFRVRNTFRIRINNVISVWQLATTVAAVLVLPIRHSGGFTFVAGWAIHLYIDQWREPFHVFHSMFSFPCFPYRVYNTAFSQSKLAFSKSYLIYSYRNTRLLGNEISNFQNVIVRIIIF